MSRTSIKSQLALTAALVMLLGLGSAAAGQDDDLHKKRIHIKRQIKDSDDERIVERHKMIFVGEDGNLVEIKGDGEGFAWTSGGEGEHVFRMGGFGPGAFLGVGTTELTKELRGHFGAPENSGVMISKVIDDSGAFTAGVLVGDIITAVDGEAIASGSGLRHAIRQHEEGDSVTLEVWRDGKVQNLSAILGENEGAGFGGLHSIGELTRSIKLDCDDNDDGDCNIFFAGGSDLCGDSEECDVQVSCDDGECTCTVDGEETECEGLEGIHIHHHD